MKPIRIKIHAHKKINLSECVFTVLRLIKEGTPLDIAINDVANSVSYDFPSYQRTWDFLHSLVW